MTWWTIAARDLRESLADGTLWRLGILFGAGGLVAGSLAVDGGGAPLVVAVLALGAAPLTAVLLAHDSLPARRASGRTRLTLSLPHSRRAYVLGTAAGAFGVAVGALAVAVGATSTVAVLGGGNADAGLIAAVTVVGVALTAALVAGTVAATATLRSPTLAAGVTVALYGGSLLWPVVVLLAAGLVGVPTESPVVTGVLALSPVQAAALALSVAGVSVTPLAGVLPWWAGVLVLAAWVVCATALAVQRFRRLEL